MVSDEAKAWVEQVLGVKVPASARPAAPAGFDAKGWDAAKQTWRDASDTADAQISALIKRLRDDPDPGMQAIADTGLNALTEGYKVKLMAAIVDVDKAAGSPAALRKLATAADGFAGFLASDPRIAACDRCPDVEIAIAATLARGLDALKASSAGPAGAAREQAA